MFEKLPVLIDHVAEGFSGTILASLKTRWLGAWRQQQRDMKGFRKRLDSRWGEASAALGCSFCATILRLRWDCLTESWLVAVSRRDIVITVLASRRHRH
jgi:hypothetical protein